MRIIILLLVVFLFVQFFHEACRVNFKNNHFILNHGLASSLYENYKRNIINVQFMYCAGILLNMIRLSSTMIQR